MVHIKKNNPQPLFEVLAESPVFRPNLPYFEDSPKNSPDILLQQR